MGAQNMPVAEIDISVDLVKALVSEQFPDLASLDVRRHSHGWDNAMFRLGDDLVARLPRRQVAAKLIDHEAKWLRHLAPRLPLPVPAPVRLGQASDSYPWRWTVLPWFEGEPAGTTPFADQAGTAHQLGGFLAALHTASPPNAPLNPYRGGPLAERNEITAERIETVSADIDVESVRTSWEQTAAVPAWDGPAMWLHGDLHPFNVVQRDGQLAAVIDFGDITGGDPATDLMIAWALFDEQDRRTLRAAAESAARPIDDEMWERGRGWAITHSLAVLANGADVPALRAMSLRTLRAAVT